VTAFIVLKAMAAPRHFFGSHQDSNRLDSSHLTFGSVSFQFEPAANISSRPSNQLSAQFDTRLGEGSHFFQALTDESLWNIQHCCHLTSVDHLFVRRKLFHRNLHKKMDACTSS